MKRNIDIEDLLRRHRIDQSPGVKRAILSRFEEAFGRRVGAGIAAVWWRRAVPVYLVAVFIVITAGASFFAGRSVSQDERAAEGLQEQLLKTEIIEAEELKWEVAENDVL